MEIRYLRPDDDRNAVSRVYEESWKHAYRGIISDSYLDSIPAGRWASNLDRQGMRSMVLTVEGEIVGTSGFCPARAEDMRGWGEIVSIYFLPEYMGRGYGGQLMRAVIGELSKMGFENIYLWVLEKNHRARRFYEKLGFRPDGGTVETEIGADKLREVRYIYNISQAEGNFCPLEEKSVDTQN